jgi:ubiquinone/menaquinone biosynthesis C-methylase UbiE
VAVTAFGGLLLFYNLYLPPKDRSNVVFAIGSFFVAVGLGVAVPSAQSWIAQMYNSTLSFLLRVWPRDGGTDNGAEPAPAPLKLPYEETDATSSIDAVWTAARDVRRPILDLIGPSYVLDATYHFLDWNPAFDLLVATPLGLRRRQHAEAFVRHLANVQEVVERSKIVFAPGRDPIVDVEVLEFKSEQYGLIRFQKLAAEIADHQGNTLAWSVNLNIIDAERSVELWNAIAERMASYVRWSKYAVSYDKLLLNFDDYGALVDRVTKMVGTSQRCIDLGAGTGNGTLRLLKNPGVKEVWAVEQNESMLEYLRGKARDHVSRLTIVKEDIGRLEELPANYFDAAICINVLYAVEDREKCLRQAWRLLKPGGTLALSTSHRETDFHQLFGRMQEVLTRKGLFESLKPNYESAEAIHEAMKDLIRRDTREDIRTYVERAGFRISEWHDQEYVDAVVVVKALKVAQSDSVPS